MKRKAAVFIAAFLMVSLSASVVVHAHTGGTDSQGGHYNHSTGEYHFHHGYPAHQHTNGVCPYDFVDKSGQNSSTSESSQSKTEEPQKSISSVVESTNKGRESDIPQWVVIVSLVFVGLIFGLPVCFGILYQLWFWLKLIFSSVIKSGKKKAIEEYSEKSISELAKVPSLFKMDFDGKVYYKGQEANADQIKIVYVPNNGHCYHDTGCKIRSKNMYEVALSKAKRMGYKRCGACNACGSYPTWYTEYKRINEVRKKYKIDMLP